MKRRRFSLYDAVVTTLLALMAIIVLAPLYYVVTVSLSDPAYYKPLTISLWPKHVSFETYIYILKKPEFLTSLYNTLYVTILGTVCSLIVTFTMAYALTKREMPLHKFVVGIVIFSMLYNPGLIPNFFQVKALGLYNSRWALILPAMTNAFYLMIARSFIDSIPKELEESAMLDGCNHLVIFARIVMPLSTAALATLTLFFAVRQWNSFYDALIYLSDSSLRTLQVYVRSLVVDPSGTGISEAQDLHIIPNETIRLATVVLSILPILVVYPFAQRYFVKGAMLGSIKG